MSSKFQALKRQIFKQHYFKGNSNSSFGCSKIVNSPTIMDKCSMQKYFVILDLVPS